MADLLPAIAMLKRLAAVPLTYLLVWSVLVALCITIVALLRARWGQSRPLQKCAVLSLLFHLVIACLTMTVRIVVGDGGGGGSSPPIRVRIVDDTLSPVAMAPVMADIVPEVTAPALLDVPPVPLTPDSPLESDASAVTNPESEPVATEAPVAVAELKVATVPEVVTDSPKLVEPEKVEPELPPKQVAHEPTAGVATAPAPLTPIPAASEKPAPLPVVAVPGPTVVDGAYANRAAPGRIGLIESQGGNAHTEAAVVAALQWLAAAQSPDGRWDADHFGAGRELTVMGHDRHGAGRNADTGISALALLAFLGAGHSHQQGDHQATVRKGLDFLIRSQATDGSIFGSAELYAQMYCHSMATFALAEAAAMSGDQRLVPTVSRATNFCLRAQNTSTGGWRYRPGDTGDTSQLGWQIMALASAERAGLNLPQQAWTGVEQFLRNVRRGNYGGLASYRPDSPASTSMTAEALYCRVLIADKTGEDVDDLAAGEATRRMLGALPDADHVNLYYWYYATLALHHRQQTSDQAVAAWHAWNDALTTALVSKQVTIGANAGSWNTDCLWGGYGGRVYTTAMSAMCLEVYYRYAPEPAKTPWIAVRPESNAPH